ncbi:hypothetical protein [Actinomadura bangladeshensis]|uniref:Uncharacterized protein n=1 Tax=Actinomadura bangladeshensis TaxID=453573 RepID=A0A4R4NCS1_9ACTN|nr:hypothetical protein [Actinomadura bangladeshensis]TDC06881.1 hypothetical protein E1284_33215 [Actinomadura bangladeshensis]
MSDHDEAVAAALDAYQQHLLPDDAPSHRADPTLAEPLITSLIEQLARYAEARDLDIHDTLAELHQQRLDSGGPDHDPSYNFRLGAEVQFRQQRTATGAKPHYPLWRGFITALATAPDGEPQCTVRVPGISEGLHVTAFELEPADSLLPLPTRTAGVVCNARDAESTIIDIAVRLKRAAGNGLVPDEQALTDLAQLTMRLSTWSGGRPDAIMRHLYDRIIDTAQRPPSRRPGPDAAARLSATEFPQQPGPSRSDGPPASSTPKPDHPPRPRRPRP